MSQNQFMRSTLQGSPASPQGAEEAEACSISFVESYIIIRIV